jgi:hypothetical protein
MHPLDIGGPDARVRLGYKRMHHRGPAVKVTGYTYRAGVRRPYGEPPGPVPDGVRTEHTVGAAVCSLVEKVKIVRFEQSVHLSSVVCDSEPIRFYAPKNRCLDVIRPIFIEYGCGLSCILPHVQYSNISRVWQTRKLAQYD